jgi:hypothetical protein
VARNAGHVSQPVSRSQYRKSIFEFKILDEVNHAEDRNFA